MIIFWLVTCAFTAAMMANDWWVATVGDGIAVASSSYNEQDLTVTVAGINVGELKYIGIKIKLKIIYIFLNTMQHVYYCFTVLQLFSLSML